MYSGIGSLILVASFQLFLPTGGEQLGLGVVWARAEAWLSEGVEGRKPGGE